MFKIVVEDINGGLFVNSILLFTHLFKQFS